MDQYSFLNTAHTTYFAELYDQYLINPEHVELWAWPIEVTLLPWLFRVIGLLEQTEILVATPVASRKRAG